MQLQISSEDCELLRQFAESEGLAQLARSLGRDISVVSRRLQKLADAGPVLEKRRGRWQLTDLGQELVRWTKDMTLSQNQLLGRPQALKIATNREFASRVLAPALPELLARFPLVRVEIHSYEQGTEAALLRGEIDIALDCGRPSDPEVQFRLLAKEQLALVASPALLKKHPISRLNDLSVTPHLALTRMNCARYLKLQSQLETIVARFNDIAACRAAAVAGAGWALLPYYAVKEELDAGKLKKLDLLAIEQETYGLWWLRQRKFLKPYLAVFEEWMKGIEL